MRYVVVLAVMMAGCSTEGLSLPMAQPQPSGPECAWHFLLPGDTNNSENTPGVSKCDADRFMLRDAAVSIVAESSGAFSSGECHAFGRATRWDDRSWQVLLDECGLSGAITVNF